MHSGDYSVHDQLSTLGAPMPPLEWLPDIISSFDCTNGAEHIHTWREEIERMADDGHIALKSGGWFFTFAFAMDRCPTFARKLADLGLPVYLDGPSAIELAEIMRSPNGFWCEQDRPIKTEGIGICERVGEALEVEDRGAIVAPSGMGNGPATRYLTELLPREEAVIGASGFVAPGTNGWKILRAQRGSKVTIEGDKGEPVEITVAARCEQYRATAHSLRRDAMRRVDELLHKSGFRKNGEKPTVVLCHGSASALDWFEKALPWAKTFRADSDRNITLLEE